MKAGKSCPSERRNTRQTSESHNSCATPFEEKPKYLICDNDNRYGPMFERVAQASGIEVIHTPYEAPRANAICERFV